MHFLPISLSPLHLDIAFMHVSMLMMSHISPRLFVWFYFVLFSLCSSDYVLTIDLTSSLRILSFVISNLLLSPS